MKRALISVSDKTNIVAFAKDLITFGYEIISTGNTKIYLEDNGIDVTSVFEVTNFPEILDGRVKTLHPNIHAGILAKRSEVKHQETLEDLSIEYIDMVVVNLYPFKSFIDSNCDFQTAIENIDVGGPSMIRSAAKNFNDVCVVCDINDYSLISKELYKNSEISYDLRLKLSAKAFKHCSNYDLCISNYLSNDNSNLNVNLDLAYELRYGENPHQKAWFYQDDTINYSLSKSKILNGKQLSYNNILDASACLNILKEFDECCVVAIKHNNPCGVSCNKDLKTAFLNAYNSDSVSIFGGILGFNRCVTKEVATLISEIFLEVIIAPCYDEDALEILKTRKNLRVLEVKMESNDLTKVIKSVNGGILVQEYDNSKIENINVICGELDNRTRKDLEFAFKVCKHVKSNAICVCNNESTLGIGAGQMSRIAACEIALKQAKEKNVQDLVLASDAFFPFTDCIELAAKYNVVAIIQPGGSIRDQEVIDTCKKHNITLVFTNIRNFNH